MRCNLCGSMDANIRPIELPTARITLRAHVDCSGHGQYRSVSREEIKEATNRDARLLNAIPEMLDCLHTARTLLSTVVVAASWNDDTIGKLVPECLAFMHASSDILAKIEGGGDAE